MDSKLQKIALIIEKNLEFENSNTGELQLSNRDQLLEQIGEIVAEMIESDFEKFLALMYRLDISEKKLNTALSSNPSEVVKEKVAELILKREEEKYYWREKYGHNQS